MIYTPKYDLIKNQNYRPTIGHDIKVDDRKLNPLTGRSPGPMYNTQKSFVNKHAFNFGLNLRKSVDSETPGSN